MVRDILFPKQQVFRHEREANRLIFYLAGVVAIMIGLYYYYAFYIHGLREDEKVGYLLAGIDMMLTGIPPGLSLCLMLGVSYGVENLKNDGIDCFQPRLVNAIGRVKTALFDKTGTLTESFMKLAAVYKMRKSKLLN